MGMKTFGTIRELIGYLWESKAKWMLEVAMMTMVVPGMLCLFKPVILSAASYLLNLICAQPEQVIVFIEKEAGFWGSAIWTLTSMVAAFTIFYYSSLGTKNYGMTNRKLLSYSYGPYFIPMLLASIFFLAIWMSAAYYLEAYTKFFIVSGYSFLLQVFLIFLCILSTSGEWGQKKILDMERETYRRLYKDMQAGELRKIKFHADTITRGTDDSEEMFSILRRIFEIPFQWTVEELSLSEKERKKMRRNSSVEKNIPVMYDFTSDDLFGNQELETLFYYVFQNMKIMVENTSNKSEAAVPNEMYEMLYELIEELEELLSEKADERFRMKKLMFLSAVFQVVMVTEAALGWNFIAHVIDSSVTDPEEKRMVIGIYLASVGYLLVSGQLESGLLDRGLNEEQERERLCRLEKLADNICQFHFHGWRMDADLEKMMGDRLSVMIPAWARRTTGKSLQEPEVVYQIINSLKTPSLDSSLDRLMSFVRLKMQ